MTKKVTGAAELAAVVEAHDASLLVGVTCGLSAPYVAGQLDYALKVCFRPALQVTDDWLAWRFTPSPPPLPSSFPQLPHVLLLLLLRLLRLLRLRARFRRSSFLARATGARQARPGGKPGGKPGVGEPPACGAFALGFNALEDARGAPIELWAGRRSFR